MAKTATSGAAFVALLRGINVGGNKMVPMAELRALATKLGWRQVATYIQSGNVVFACAVPAAAAERALEQAIARHFGFPVPVVVRTAAQWLSFAAKSPFADAARERPGRLHLGASKVPPAAGAAQALLDYAKAGERIAIQGSAIWIDFPAGVGRSKLTPTVLDRLVGSPVTLRNWKTVQAIAGLLRAPA